MRSSSEGGRPEGRGRKSDFVLGNIEGGKEGAMEGVLMEVNTEGKKKLNLVFVSFVREVSSRLHFAFGFLSLA